MKLATEQIRSDVCVVGGGLAGVCAALAAARDGSTVSLLQDRPVLGGNASSEIRMWICGAYGRFFKESGLLEEIQLKNIHRNPEQNYHVWDSVLYELVAAEENIRLLLNCSVCDVSMDSARIGSIRGWQMTRQTWIEVLAEQFIDCSGDSILRLSGAHWRSGREDRESFGESLGREIADRQTMGNSILIQAREIDPEDHCPFVPPAFARSFDDSHPRVRNARPNGDNYWWIEVGGEDDTIADAESIRDELMAIAYGAWAYIKNHPDGRGRRWTLDWISALPGKRENIRYVGAHTLTQNDIESGGRFDDLIAFGGWTMDDHPPAAFDHPGEPTCHYPTPSPYGIPAGCLYGETVPNLLFAGRNISTTHMALSSTRVMGTCAMLGQAAGTLAAMAVQKGKAPGEIHRQHLIELQNRLMWRDQWLPGLKRPLNTLTSETVLSVSEAEDDAEVLRNGLERSLPDGANWLRIRPGGHVTFSWERPVDLLQVRLVMHSDLHNKKRIPCHRPKKVKLVKLPRSLPKTILIEARDGDDWRTVSRLEENHRRLVIQPLDVRTDAVRIRIVDTWGGEFGTLFSAEFGPLGSALPPLRVPWPETIVSGHGE